jgi:hypothetical protein
MISLQNINRSCGDKSAGILKIYVGYADDVSSIPDPVYNVVQDDIVMITGKRFKTFEATEQTAVFNETKKDSDMDGNFYDWILSFFIPGDDNELAQMVQQMVSKKFIVIYKDITGIYRILGSVSNPLKFTNTSTTGDTPGSRSGYVFTFSGSEQRKAYFFTGNILNAIESDIPASYDEGYDEGYYI